jgi:3-hydroxyacyl-[acyl-carrier-protein] dehydratase
MRFLFVDRILEMTPGKEAVILKNVSNSEDFFDDHFPGRPIMPGCLILESCDQAARLLLARSAEFRQMPKLTTVGSGKFRHLVQPGDALQVQVTVVAQEAGTAKVRATVTVGSRVMAQAVLSYELVAAAEDPAAARACRRLQEFYQSLITDPFVDIMERQSRAAGSTET